MRLLIGMDDTDNKESRGTGFKARQLAHLILEKDFGILKGITRHQLYVHPDIAYTSQNSSACLDVETEHTVEMIKFCTEFLMREASEGSDAGLCIIRWDHITADIINWGKRAKKEVLTLKGAQALASKWNFFLQGFTGKRIGQIGALAAVGLRRGGNDGRFIWLKGSRELRDFDAGIYSVGELLKSAGIDQVSTKEGTRVSEYNLVHCDGWTRPVLTEQQAVLLVEKSNDKDNEWKTIGKEYIRSIS
ncbi:MAG: hypothetical protein KQI35_15650 [Bacteroidetes bacterium]|nr:hypothetical protein [Bacteroidota bacterium]